MGGFSMSEYKKYLKVEKVTFFCSWFNIVLFMVFVFPIGLFAYWKRTKADPSAMLQTWKLVLAFGLILVLTCLNVFIQYGGGWVNLLLGIAVTAVGLIMRRNAYIRMDIIGCFLMKREFNIRRVAMFLHKNEAVIHNQIDTMIKKGMLPGAIVDYDKNEIYIPGYTGDGLDEYAAKLAEMEGSDTDTEEKAFVEEVNKDSTEGITENVCDETEVTAVDDTVSEDDEEKPVAVPDHCTCCDALLTPEAKENKKCQVCGRIYD